MMDSAVGPERLSLSVEFLNCSLEMIINTYKVAHLLKLFKTKWDSDRKGFTTIKVAVLMGNV